MTPHLAGLIEPVIDADAVPFWDAIAEGRLVVPTCMSCGTTFYPPLPCCPSCQSELIEHVEAEGTGTLYSWVVMRRALDPAFAPVRGIFVAQVIKPQARVLAESRGIACVEVDYDELRGIESDELRLF